MLSKNFATPEDRLVNYVAGQELMKRWKHKPAAGAAPEIEIGQSTNFTPQLLRGRNQANLHNPIVPNMADYVNWILYDRSVTAAGGSYPNQQLYFTVPIGTSSKTKVDTNLSQVSQLPAPYWMNVTHIGFYWHPNTILTDIVNFLGQSYMEFICNDKVYAEGPIQFFPGGSGVSGATVQTGVGSLNNGTPMGTSVMFDLRLPAGIGLGINPTNGQAVVSDGLTGINILQSQLFKTVVNLPGGALTLTANTATPVPGTGLSLYVFLYGILSRSVS